MVEYYSNEYGRRKDMTFRPTLRLTDVVQRQEGDWGGEIRSTRLENMKNENLTRRTQIGEPRRRIK